MTFDYDDYYKWWAPVEIHSPMTIVTCRYCGSLVNEGDSDAMATHRKRHEYKGELPE